MTKKEQFTAIARQHLGIETLEERGNEEIDFHIVGVVGVAAALDAAHKAGQTELFDAARALLEAKDNQMETVVEWRRLRRAVRRLQ